MTRLIGNWWWSFCPAVFFDDKLAIIKEHIKTLADMEDLLIAGELESAEAAMIFDLREDIELTLETGELDLPVMVDSGQIEQVLVNLTTNALDAMPDGGRLTIGTTLVDLDDQFIKAHGYGERGRFALLTFSDSGSGIDEMTLQKIFEPFFTTKEVGKGTGLGLAMAYGIIKQHKGYINCYSEPGRGTTFRIYLPLISSKDSPKEVPVAAPPTRGTETVLLAEDDAQLLEMTKELLCQFGYQVIAAADGEEAVAKFMENKDSIQLAILDVIMPKKNGKEVCQEIIKVKPEIRVLFSSGYPANVLGQGEIMESGYGFIGKPSVPQVFLQKVREVLDR